MKAISYLIVISVFAVTFYLIYLIVTNQFRQFKTNHVKRRVKNTRWKILEDIDNDRYLVYLARSDDASHRDKGSFEIGSVPTNHPDFEYEIEELRSFANTKLIALNSSRELDRLSRWF